MIHDDNARAGCWLRSLCSRSSLWGILLILLMATLGPVSVRVVAAAEPAKWSAPEFRERLARTQIRVHEVESSPHVWYTIADAAGQPRYVLINTTTGEKRIAANLSAFGISENSERQTSQLPPVSTPRSPTSNDRCPLEFVNQSGREVRISWRNSSGEAVQYAVLADGQAYSNSTFVGHIWEVEELGGATITRFSASPFWQRLVIDGPPQKNVSQKAVGSTEPKRRGRSPDGVWQADVDDREIVIKELSTGATHRVTGKLRDGARFFDPVVWSPAGDAFVVSAAVPVPTRQISLVQSSPGDQLQPKLLTFDYAKPGDDLPQPVPVLFQVAAGQFTGTVIDSTTFPQQFNTSSRHEYRWSLDGAEFYFDVNDRGHQRFRVLAVRRSDASLRTIVEETSSTFLHYEKFAQRHWLPETNELIWSSERSGWNHFWNIDITGQRAPMAITAGNWVTQEIVKVEPTTRTLWFMATGLRPGEDPYHRHLCRVQFDGSGFQQLTEGDGTHDIEFLRHDEVFVDTWSRVDRAPVTELRGCRDGHLIAELSAVETADFSEFGTLPERFRAKGRDGATDIYGVIVRPSNFDQNRKYPVVENVYAGPHSAFTPKKFGSHAGLQEIAELGFIVVQADGMGTNHRGKKFHDVCWQNLKDAGFPDRIAWMQAAAQTRPWMDLSRVGIYGGSAGGQTAMRALLDHHDFYQVAVADCGCHDNRVDKLWWSEQWLGWPINPSYAGSSNVVDAHRLRGKLLLIVGELDRNVDPACTYQVAHALQQAGLAFELLPIMNAGHGAAETPVGARARREFLVRHLQPGP